MRPILPSTPRASHFYAFPISGATDRNFPAVYQVQNWCPMMKRSTSRGDNAMHSILREIVEILER